MEPEPLAGKSEARMPKQYVKLRVGLLDHMPLFAGCPDAFLVYGYCLLQAPMSGPDAGCVRINQAAMSDRWGWSKPRLSRALSWLQTNPARNHPLLVCVEKGRRNQPGRYAIPRFERTENTGRFGNGGGTKPPEFVSDSVTQVERIGRFVSDSVTEMERNSNKNARVRKNESKKNEEEGYAVYEHADWITVRTEAEAREALRLWRGYGQLPDTMQDQAIETAMKNLEFYRIRYDDDDDEQEATG